MQELSDLQATLYDPMDRAVFSRMVFPKAKPIQNIEVLTIGESDHRHVIVRSEIADKHGVSYSVRAPLEPAEIGQLYRLLFRADFPKVISEQIDTWSAWTEKARSSAESAIAIRTKTSCTWTAWWSASLLKDEGSARRLLDDFCLRMAAENVRVVKTHFFLRQFCLPRGFQVDRRWGGLVRSWRRRSTVVTEPRTQPSEAGAASGQPKLPRTGTLGCPLTPLASPWLRARL